MPIRLKVFLIITVIILAITASSVIISISSAQNEIINTLESSMRTVATGANEFISGEIDYLMSDASSVVEALRGVSTEEMHLKLMEQQLAWNETFSSIVIFNPSGRIEASYSDVSAPKEINFGEYGQMALEGARVFSSTQRDSTGLLFFQMFVPMDETRSDGAGRTRVVAFTVPGLYLSDKVNQFEGTGNIANITIGDAEGTIIASKNETWVEDRLNLKNMVKANELDTIQRMMAGETGGARYIFNGADAVSAFLPLTGSKQGWFVTVTALVVESPFRQVRNLIIISGFIFLGLGLLAAAVASGSVARPFYVIQTQNEKLREMGEVIKAAAVAKTNFLANMSFDMRTPLNAVIGLSELGLTKKGVPADVRSYLDRIYESGITLMEVVNDLLDISNMESGKFGIIPAEYDLPDLIADTAYANTVHIGSKPITFKIIPDGTLPAKLVGDSLRIRQIFNNLLTNAFRHTSAGTVEWRISATQDGDSVWLVSSVTDTGQGIKPEDLDKIFIDYNRPETDRKRNLEGALSLTLTKKIADLMDGTITVDSVFEKGSTFTVRIRQKYVNDAVISAETAESLKNFKYIEQKRTDNADMQRTQFPKARVLVVDDVDINLEIAHGMMEPYGVTVDCLGSGEEAVEIVRLGEPAYDMIFISRWMPGMDGKKAVEIIRNEVGNDYAKNVPIIALTTNTVIGNKDVFLSWGFQDVLSKPLNVRYLDAVINTWMKGK